METIKDISINNVKIAIVKGDITESNVDAIVNAANSHLQHGGGVAGVISRKGGPLIQEESNTIGYVPVGECAMTSGGRLKAPHVIHTVGPRMGEGNEENKLKKAINNVLKLATSEGLVSIAIPAISAGIFGFPKDKCANILVGETATFVREQKTTLKEIVFCLIDTDIINFFTAEIMKQERGVY
jgi:O-acetyl-ADP-ribose deacetylase